MSYLSGIGDSAFAPLSGDNIIDYGSFNDIEVNGNIYLKEATDTYTGYNVPLITTIKGNDDMVFNTTTLTSNWDFTVGTSETTKETVFRINPTTGLAFDAGPTTYNIDWIELSYLNGSRSNIQTQIDNLSPDLASNQGYWGNFWNSTTVTNPTINTVNLISFPSADPNNYAVTVASSNRVTVGNAGIYMFIATIQLNKSSGSTEEDVFFWIRLNGVDVADTAFKESVKNTPKLVTANWQLKMNAGDYIQIAWSSPDIHMQLVAFPAGTTPAKPGIPSIILTVSQISFLVAGGAGLLPLTYNSTTNRVICDASFQVLGRTDISGSLFLNGSTVATFPDVSTNFMFKTGTITETITGIKTFSSVVRCSTTPTAGNDLVNITYGIANYGRKASANTWTNPNYFPGLYINNSDGIIPMTYELDVSGSGNFKGNVRIKSIVFKCDASNIIINDEGISSTGNFNLVAGWGAGKALANSRNIFLGANCCPTGFSNSAIDRTDNVFIGYDCGGAITANSNQVRRNVVIGSQAGRNLGVFAGGGDNVLIGYNVATGATYVGTSVVIGSDVASTIINGTLQGTVIIGSGAAKNATSLNNTTIIGYRSGETFAGNYGVFMGVQCGTLCSSSSSWNMTFIGFNCDIYNFYKSFTNSTAVGSRTYVNSSDQFVIGGWANLNGAAQNLFIQDKCGVMTNSTITAVSTTMTPPNFQTDNSYYGENILLSSAVTTITLPLGVSRNDTNLFCNMKGARYTFIKNYPPTAGVWNSVTINAPTNQKLRTPAGEVSSYTFGPTESYVSFVCVDFKLTTATPGWVSWALVNQSVPASTNYVDITSSQTISGSKTFTADTSFNNVRINGNQTVSGTTTLTGNTTVGNLAITGTVTGLSFASLSLSGNLNVAGDSSFNNVDVAGNTKLRGNVTEIGDSTTDRLKCTSGLVDRGDGNAIYCETGNLSTLNDVYMNCGTVGGVTYGYYKLLDFINARDQVCYDRGSQGITDASNALTVANTAVGLATAAGTLATGAVAAIATVTTTVLPAMQLQIDGLITTTGDLETAMTAEQSKTQYMLPASTVFLTSKFFNKISIYPTELSVSYGIYLDPSGTSTFSGPLEMQSISTSSGQVNNLRGSTVNIADAAGSTNIDCSFVSVGNVGNSSIQIGANTSTVAVNASNLTLGNVASNSVKLGSSNSNITIGGLTSAIYIGGFLYVPFNPASFASALAQWS